MLWLDVQEPHNVAAAEAQKLFKNAFIGRWQPSQLSAALKRRINTNPVPPDVLANLLMGFRNNSNNNGNSEDPLLAQYIKLLLREDFFHTGHLLHALLQRSRFSAKGPKPPEHRWGLQTCEEMVFNTIMQLHMSEEATIDREQLHQITLAVTRWLHMIREYETAKQLEHDTLGTLYALDAFTYSTYESFASMVITVFGSMSMRAVTKQKWWKIRRPIVVRELNDFDLNVLQWMHSQLSGRLQTLARIPPFVATDAKGRPIFTDQQILDSITNVPAVPTRAGLYIWINACLCARPMTDDISMFQHLQARHPGDTQSIITNLIIACFDAYTNARLRKESSHSLKIMRSFICNKIPSILSLLASMIVPPMTAEGCIQVAFMSITMDALPPISAGATDVRDLLKKTRLEFLQACHLFGLVSESTISGILQEPATLPKVTKQTREGVVAQCSNNLGRLDALMPELQAMSGNAGAVAGCIIDLINNFCASKDTISLKSLCNLLLRKFSDMDIVMQYTQPAGMLLPLVNVLNDWVHDQDQTEFTPSYEEFASILLFTLAMIHRFEVSKADLGLTGAESFVFRLLQNISQSLTPSELTPEQSQQLSSWVEGLFSTDDSGESSGISDEVMRQCPPQAFYILVPTLFEQSVLCCKANVLNVRTLQGGLELLLEPFLLPSLIGGLRWLITHSWEDHNDADLLLQILEKLMKPSSSSQDTQAMHRAVVGMVSDALVHTLQDLVKRHPNKKNAVAMIEMLRPHTGRQRLAFGSKAEVDEWSSTKDGGMSQCLRTNIRDLVAWTSSVGPTPPTKYTHLLFNTACKLLGPHQVLDDILAELKDETLANGGSVVLDIATAMICSPIPGLISTTTALGATAPQNYDTQCSVRDVLRLIVSDAQRLLDRPNKEVQALVRLSRSVEAQSAPPQMAQMPIALPIQTDQQATDQMMQDLGLTDGNDTAANAGNNTDATATADFTAALDLSAPTSQEMANLTTAATADGSNAMQIDTNQQSTQDFFADLDMSGTGGDINAEEDIFAGLDMGGVEFKDDDFGF